ncbi:P-loop containing nucleoside triphosphate hydrolases superfamily protein isoform X2 [Carex rostrata]
MHERTHSEIGAASSAENIFEVPPRDPDEKRKKDDQPNVPPARYPSRSGSSKYDFVKVKVWLGENADHYYVLSRFLLSRMLTVTKIPNHVAIKIALELKKLLVDNSLLDVSQSDLEANLFKLMERRGYGEEYINRYKMMTRFHHQRVPLVILVCGTACTGKSTVATQLAQRLNLPNVLHTDMVHELIRTSTDAPLTSTPVWARDFNSPEELIKEFCRECRIVRKGLAGDLKKAMKDGKPIIIEGIHLDPSIYLMDEEKKDSIDKSAEEPENKILGSQENNPDIAKNCSSEKGTSQAEESSSSQAEESKHATDPPLASSETKEKMPNETELQNTTAIKKEKTAADPITIPIVLRMAEFDHKALLEEWIATRAIGDKSLMQDRQKLINNLKTIQDYLCSFKPQGIHVVNISASTFTQTLDSLHNYLLQCIEHGVSDASKAEKLAQEN